MIIICRPCTSYSGDGGGSRALAVLQWPAGERKRRAYRYLYRKCISAVSRVEYIVTFPVTDVVLYRHNIGTATGNALVQQYDESYTTLNDLSIHTGAPSRRGAAIIIILYIATSVDRS